MKECSDCGKTQDLCEFHGHDVKKSQCKTCVKLEYFKKKQSKLHIAWNDGDTKIDLCECGVFYVNELRRGTGMNIRTECYACSSAKKILISQTKADEFTLRAQVQVLKKAKRELEKEVVSLRQLVAKYRQSVDSSALGI